MKEQLITLDTAKLAKEKGFNGLCYDCYNLHGMQYSNGWCEYIDDNEVELPFKSDVLTPTDMLAPTQSLLQKWLRDVHGIHIEINSPDMPKQLWYGHLRRVSKFGNICDLGEYDTYEEALEVGLQEALKLIN